MSDRRHAFDRPLASDLTRSLREVIGDPAATAAIGLALRDAVSATAQLDVVSPVELLEVARALTRQRGLVAVIGRSFEIRMLSFLELAPDPALAAGGVAALDPGERARLRELGELDLGADIDQPELQRLVQRAAIELELPLAAVSLVLDSTQYFVETHGFQGWLARARGTPVEWAFCRHAVDARQPFIVEDATNHALVEDNPLVVLDGIRCYLGIPLITRNAQPLGTLCVLGVEEREFSAIDVDRLQALADQVLILLEARRQ